VRDLDDRAGGRRRFLRAARTRKGVILLGLTVLLAAACALAPAVELPDPALDARVERLAAELRCLVCDNQTIADSNAQLARDLKARVREQLAKGRSEEQVIAFLTERYGDFVLYRPPVKASTWPLWFGPFGLLGFGLWWLWKTLARQQREAGLARKGVK
jgi:cytochrome c-type biogenesis protein CcmH